MSQHLVSHVTRPELRSDNTLHVVGVISNTERYQSRLRLARDWIARTEKTPNVQLHLVEAAFGDRQHELETTTGSNLRLRINTNAWIKENLINLAVRNLVPRDAKYICWEDCDVEHRDPNWAQETIHALQHFPVVQTWQSGADLGFHGSVYQLFESFGHVDQTGKLKHPHKKDQPYTYAHTGYSWACTRAFFEETGGLLDIAVLGSADHHMAWGIVGRIEETIPKQMHPNYLRACLDWQAKAQRAAGGEVGFVSGRIEHHFHGPKKRRYYVERWQILAKAGFDPLRDIRRDEQGVIHCDRNPALEKAIRQYNRSRLEDSIEES